MRISTVVTALALVSGTVLGVCPSAAAAPPQACSATAPIPGDYDGDGTPDPAISALQGAAPGSWVALSGAGADRWVPGDAMADLDLNGDACSDAVVIDAAASTVSVWPGTPHGLNPAGALPVPVPQATGLAPGETLRISAIGLRNHRWVQVIVAGVHVRAGREVHPFVNISTRQSSGEFGDPFTFEGTLFGSGDATGFGTRTALSGSGNNFAVGAPATSVKRHKAAGAVYLFSGLTDGSYYLDSVSQDLMPGAPEAGDKFGASVSLRGRWLAVGVPGETIGRAVHTGMVQPIYWNGDDLYLRGYRPIHQGLKGVPGANEDGDNFGREVQVARGLTGSGSYDILISARERIGSHAAAGSVTVANVTAAKFLAYDQGSARVPGAPGSGDGFGSLGVLRNSAVLDTVLIGAPGEDRTGCQDCGYVISSDGRKLSGRTSWVAIAASPSMSGITAWGRGFARS
jgi:hypothetical protein